MDSWEVLTIDMEKCVIERNISVQELLIQIRELYNQKRKSEPITSYNFYQKVDNPSKMLIPIEIKSGYNLQGWTKTKIREF